MAEETATQTVLIIEDDTNIRKMTSLRLAREGYRVLTAPAGEEGLEVARRERPHVILLDVLMPEMDGREVLRRLKADPDTCDIPVILLSVLRPEDGLAESIPQGQAIYLSKPYKHQDLLKTVHFALSGRSRQWQPPTTHA
jgi:two-component system cell cycle response regulator